MHDACHYPRHRPPDVKSNVKRSQQRESSAAGGDALRFMRRSAMGKKGNSRTNKTNKGAAILLAHSQDVDHSDFLRWPMRVLSFYSSQRRS